MAIENIIVIVVVLAALGYAAYWVVKQGPGNRPDGCAGCKGCSMSNRPQPVDPNKPPCDDPSKNCPSKRG